MRRLSEKLTPGVCFDCRRLRGHPTILRRRVVRAGLVCETPASGKATRCRLVGGLVRADSVIFFFELFDQPYVIRRELSRLATG